MIPRTTLRLVRDATAFRMVRIDFAVRPCLPITRPMSSLATLSSSTVVVSASVSFTSTASGWFTSCFARNKTSSFMGRSSFGAPRAGEGRSGCRHGRADVGLGGARLGGLLASRLRGRLLDQLSYGRRRLRSLRPPRCQLLGVDLDQRRGAGGVVEPDLVDEPAVARRFRAGDDDTIDWVFLAAVTGETDLHHADVFPRSRPKPAGIPPCIIWPEPSFLSTFLVWVNCFSSLLTSDTEVPLPAAMRLRRLALRIWMLRRSSF